MASSGITAGAWKLKGSNMSILKSLFGAGSKTNKPLETSDENFEADVLKSELPALVDFWSPTCAPCQVMGGLLRDVVPEYAGRVNIYKLNVAENPKTAQMFKIRSIPTLVFIKNGRIMDQQVGLMQLNTLRQYLDKLAN